jgi:heme-degrading monooxygenase HmoA
MIVRHFTAKASPENARKYYVFLRDMLTPKLKEIPGHLGALVLSNEGKDDVHITVLTFWESDEAIRQFAGDNPEKAVIEPEARGLLSSFDDRVTRLVVELNTLQDG